MQRLFLDLMLYSLYATQTAAAYLSFSHVDSQLVSMHK